MTALETAPRRETDRRRPTADERQRALGRLRALRQRRRRELLADIVLARCPGLGTLEDLRRTLAEVLS